MNATPFLLVCLVFFGVMAAAAIHHEFPGEDTLGKGLAVFFFIMAVWAAGLLLQPVKII